ncbi:MAG: hypothetical protein ACKVOW_18130, partial [Chitinophagaceae bacterium]
MNMLFNKNPIAFFVSVLLVLVSSSCKKEIKKDIKPDVIEVFGGSPFGPDPTCQEFLQADLTADSI